MPKISIIIPVYNKVCYLEKCVKKLLTSQHTNIEIIIVDDGSMDGSSNLTDELALLDTRITVIHQMNQGVSVARNTGLDCACGEWIWFVDADDIPIPDWYESIIDEVINCDIIFGNFEKIDKDGNSKIVSADVSGPEEAKDLLNSFFRQQYINGFYGYLWCKLIRRSLIDEIKNRFESGLTLAEDLKFMVRLYNEGYPRVYYIPTIAMLYQVDTLNNSLNKQIDYRNQFEIQRDIYSWAEKNATADNIAVIRRVLTNYVAFILYYEHEDGIKVEDSVAWLNDQKDLRQIMQCDRKSLGVMSIISKLFFDEHYWTLKTFLSLRSKISILLRKINGIKKI